MRYPLTLLVLMFSLGACSTTPTPSSAVDIKSAQAAGSKPKMLSKQVCERVDEEETTGSRVGDAPQVCRTIQVPAEPPN